MMEPATVEELRARSSSGTGDDWECLSAGSDQAVDTQGGKHEHEEEIQHELSLPAAGQTQPSGIGFVSLGSSGGHDNFEVSTALPSISLSSTTSPPTPYCSRASLQQESCSSRAASEAPDARPAPRSPCSTPDTPKIATPKIKLVESDRYQKILVVGQEGLGKTTFIRTLAAAYGAQVEGTVEPTSLNIFAEDPEALCTHIRILDEDTKITYNHMIQDTPGECTNMLQRHLLMNFIGANIDKHFSLEENPDRQDTMSRHEDLRVDVCLYFIAPHAFTLADRNTIKMLAKRVPVIPILAKADCMTAEELAAFREHVMEALRDLSKETNDAIWPSFSDEDLLGAGVPPSQVFAVISSTQLDICENKFWPVRVYPWGRAEAMSSEHSDLPSLTKLLFELAPETLKAATEARYYHLRRLMMQAGSSKSSLDCVTVPEPPLQVPPQASQHTTPSASSASQPAPRPSPTPKPRVAVARVATPKMERHKRGEGPQNVYECIAFVVVVILLVGVIPWVIAKALCAGAMWNERRVALEQRTVAHQQVQHAVTRWEWEQAESLAGREPGSIYMSPGVAEVVKVLLMYGKDELSAGTNMSIWQETAAKVFATLDATPEVPGPAETQQTVPPFWGSHSCSAEGTPAQAGTTKEWLHKKLPKGWRKERAAHAEKKMAVLAAKLSAKKDKLLKKLGKTLNSSRAQKLLRRASLLAAWL